MGEVKKFSRAEAVRPNVATRLIEEAIAIEQEDAIRAGMAGFLARAMVQATLPYREPDRELPAWGRSAGDVSLIIKPGYYWNQKENKHVSMGYPFGTVPRLILAWLSTEAVRKKSKELVLGDSLGEFMNSIGITSHTGGTAGSITRLREQMKRLFASDMAIVKGGAAGADFAQSKFNVADDANLWWSPQKPEQAGLWQSTVTLSGRFYDEVIAHPVPVDLRVLRALRQSPMALDLYCYLTYRFFALNKPTTVPWEALKLQFGSGAAADKKFRETVRRALHQVVEVYPQANVEPTAGGLYLRPSLTSVPRVIKAF